jgi:hypothetical protein
MISQENLKAKLKSWVSKVPNSEQQKIFETFISQDVSLVS